MLFDEWSGRLCIGLQNQIKGFDSPTRFKLLVINLKNKNQMAKELKLEITISSEFIEKQIKKLALQDKGNILDFMSLMILRTEMNKLDDQPLKVSDKVLTRKDNSEKGAFLRSLSVIIGMATIKDNEISSGKTIEDIINERFDEDEE